MELKLFPWDNDIQPFWVNPENGLEWYVDESTTSYATRKEKGQTALDAVCFYVAERKEDKVTAISRVLMDKKTNNVLADETTLEGLAMKIDLMRMGLL